MIGLGFKVVAGPTMGFLLLRLAQFNTSHRGELWWTLEAVKWAAVMVAVLWAYRRIGELSTRLDAIRDASLQKLQEDATLEDVRRG